MCLETNINNQIGCVNRDKILFIMFQGGCTDFKNWNEYTESKFLNKLKNRLNDFIMVINKKLKL